MPVFILVSVLNKHIAMSENTPQRREVVVSGDGNCFYLKAEISNKKQKEFST